MKSIFIKQFFSIIFGMVMLFSLVPVHAMQQEEPMVKQQEVASQNYWTRFKNFLHRTPLFPGWRSTEEQKKAAEERLANLLVEREKLEDERESEQLADERLQEISKELKRISDEINEQKVILGEKWSSGRRLAAAGGLGLAGLAAGWGAKYAMSGSSLSPSPAPSSVRPLPSLPDPFKELVANKKFRWEIWEKDKVFEQGKSEGYLEDNAARDIETYLTAQNKNKEYILQHLEPGKNTADQWKYSGYGIYYDDENNKWEAAGNREKIIIEQPTSVIMKWIHEVFWK